LGGVGEAIPIGRVQGSGIDRLHRGKRRALGEEGSMALGIFKWEMVWQICKFTE
jgi:hypothetical protein